MSMKRILVAAAIAGSLGLSAGSAMAWGCGYGPGYQGQGWMGPGMMGPNCYWNQPGCGYYYGPQQFQGGPRSFEQRKIYLRGALNLTDAQKPAFESYFAAVQAYHNLQRPQLAPGASRQDVLNSRLEFQKARTAALQQAIDSRQALVKVLTPEQAAAFDAVESRVHARGPRGQQFQGYGPHHGFRGPMGPRGGFQPAPAPQAKGGTL